jgi:hypothetical protein
MAFRWWAVPVLTVVLTSAPLSAHADPVRITDGALVGDDAVARLAATGERGLTITGVGDKFGGIYSPASQCVSGPCFAGDLISIQAQFSGSDFPGNVSLDGETFRVGGGGSPDQGEALVDFQGNLLLPAFAGQTLVSLTTPFSFSGLIVFPAGDSPNPTFPIATLAGAGTATLQFEWVPPENIPGQWRFLSAAYEFAPAPVPEPGSLSLMGLGVAGLAVRRRWQQRSGSSQFPHCGAVSALLSGSQYWGCEVRPELLPELRREDMLTAPVQSQTRAPRAAPAPRLTHGRCATRSAGQPRAGSALGRTSVALPTVSVGRRI